MHGKYNYLLIKRKLFAFYLLIGNIFVLTDYAGNSLWPNLANEVVRDSCLQIG
jgi:hypothetical protein